MLGKRNIYLVGPMGSGKSAVGRILARMVEAPFLDSDAEIEKRTGVDISYIFEREGELRFRQREREAIEALTAIEPLVMATGGGAILLPENRTLLAQRGSVIYLMTSVEQLYKQGALAADDSAQTVYVDGASNLVAGEHDRDRLQELLKTLEEKQKIVGLLGAYLDAKQEAVRVVIGLDQALPSMRNFVLIGAPARVGGEVMGSLAVIGPTRIDYQNTMNAVSYIARMFDKILNESE